MAGANPAPRACPGESNRCAAHRHDGLGIVAIDVRHLSPGDAQKAVQYFEPVSPEFRRLSGPIWQKYWTDGGMKNQ